MAFFCAFALIDTDNNYKSLTKEICKNRKTRRQPLGSKKVLGVGYDI